MRHIIALLIATPLLAVPGLSYAENSAYIVNDVSVESSTGGNSAGSGEVVRGTATAEIDIESSVNGETNTYEYTETSTGSIEHSVRVDTNTEASYSSDSPDDSTESPQIDSRATTAATSGAPAPTTQANGTNVQAEASAATSFFAGVGSFFTNILSYVGWII